MSDIMSLLPGRQYGPASFSLGNGRHRMKNSTCTQPKFIFHAVFTSWIKPSSPVIQEPRHLHLKARSNCNSCDSLKKLESPHRSHFFMFSEYVVGMFCILPLINVWFNLEEWTDILDKSLLPWQRFLVKTEDRRRCKVYLIVSPPTLLSKDMNIHRIKIFNGCKHYDEKREEKKLNR